MAAETVSAYPPLAYHGDSRSYDLKHMSAYHHRNQDEINGEENDTKKMYSSSRDGSPQTVGEKKKRNVRKRNRCDMSPEELRKLRERERKAQQNRRDRIRAQKRQSQGWHDDDAAWEAFIDQTDKNNENPKRQPKKTSSLPSMVCNVSPNKAPIETNLPSKTENGESPSSMIANEARKYTDRIHNGRLDEMLSQEKLALYETLEHLPHMKKEFMSREEFEKNRLKDLELNGRREEGYHHIDIKNEEGYHHLNGNSKVPRNEDTDNKSTTSSKESLREKNDDIFDESKKKKESHDDISPTRAHMTSPLANPHHRHHHHHHHHALHSPHHLPPHGHLHYPVMYVPSDAVLPHRFSPTSHYFRERHHERHHYPDMYLPRRHHRDHMTFREEFVEHKPRHHPYDEGYHHKRHHSPPSFSPPRENPLSTSSPQEEKPKPLSSENEVSPTEKKKSVSRNVDRKKLTERELEELRRRERDYQRERRARIRMEKAKTQASHDHYQQRMREESNFYHHPASVYHALHAHEKKSHHVTEHEENVENTEYHVTRQENEETNEIDVEKTDDSLHTVNKELHLNIPPVEEMNNTEADLLQVVPKTRDCEEKTRDCEEKTNEERSPTNRTTVSKKNILENICSSLKKESPGWNEIENEERDDEEDDGEDDDEEDDEKLVIVQMNNENDEEKENTSENKNDDDQENMQILSKGSKDLTIRERIAEDQLERRRRSNREAQRRRRARLKMLGNSDDKQQMETLPQNEHDVEKRLHDEEKEHIRPDSLYDDKFGHYMHHRESRDHYFLPDKYHHYDTKHHIYDMNDKYYYYPSTYHTIPSDLHHRHLDMTSLHQKYKQEYPKHRHRSHSPNMTHQRNHHHHYHHHPKLNEDLQNNERMDDNTNEQNVNGSEETKHYPNIRSPSPNKNSSLDDSTDSERAKLNGRKRKQCAPRKLAHSTSTSPEEEIDVCKISVSPTNEENVTVVLSSENLVNPEE